MGNKDFTKRLKAFLDINKQKPFSKNAQTIFLALFGIFNESFWEKELQIDAKELQRMSQTSPNNYIKACEELAERGIIQFKTKRGVSPVFTLLPYHETG